MAKGFDIGELVKPPKMKTPKAPNPKKPRQPKSAMSDESLTTQPSTGGAPLPSFYMGGAA